MTTTDQKLIDQLNEEARQILRECGFGNVEAVDGIGYSDLFDHNKYLYEMLTVKGDTRVEISNNREAAINALVARRKEFEAVRTEDNVAATQALQKNLFIESALTTISTDEISFSAPRELYEKRILDLTKELDRVEDVVAPQLQELYKEYTRINTEILEGIGKKSEEELQELGDDLGSVMMRIHRLENQAIALPSVDRLRTAEAMVEHYESTFHNTLIDKQTELAQFESDMANWDNLTRSQQREYIDGKKDGVAYRGFTPNFQAAEWRELSTKTVVDKAHEMNGSRWADWTLGIYDYWAYGRNGVPIEESDIRANEYAMRIAKGLGYLDENGNLPDGSLNQEQKRQIVRGVIEIEKVDYLTENYDYTNLEFRSTMVGLRRGELLRSQESALKAIDLQMGFVPFDQLSLDHATYITYDFQKNGLLGSEIGQGAVKDSGVFVASFLGGTYVGARILGAAGAGEATRTAGGLMAGSFFGDFAAGFAIEGVAHDSGFINYGGNEHGNDTFAGLAELSTPEAQLAIAQGIRQAGSDRLAETTNPWWSWPATFTGTYNRVEAHYGRAIATNEQISGLGVRAIDIIENPDAIRVTIPMDRVREESRIIEENNTLREAVENVDLSGMLMDNGGINIKDLPSLSPNLRGV